MLSCSAEHLPWSGAMEGIQTKSKCYKMGSPGQEVQKKKKSEQKLDLSLSLHIYNIHINRCASKVSVCFRPEALGRGKALSCIVAPHPTACREDTVAQGECEKKGRTLHRF